MAETPQSEPGAPIAKDAIDPELVKLRRKPLRVGAFTAFGIVLLSVLFMWKINADRKFAWSGSTPEKVAAADVASGKVSTEQLVTLDAAAEPLFTHAVRVTATKGTPGLRVVPIRGTGDRVWLVLDGDGWGQPQLTGYTGRLRAMKDLTFSGAVDTYLAEHPQPMFATADAVAAALASGKVAMVTGEQISPADGDRVAFDEVDPTAAVIVGAFNEKLPDTAAWTAALQKAGIATKGEPKANEDLVRFEVALAGDTAALTDQLAKAELWAARVEPVSHHTETTWGALRGAKVLPPGKIDLVGVYVAGALPHDAYAVLTNERPDNYWYMLPVTVIVGVLALLFAWALVRAVKRDVLAPAAPTE